MTIASSSHIIVGLSGGVDSAVAAYLLKEAGHHVEGVFMKNWEEEVEGFCPAAQDMADAASVAARLGIEFHTVNFAEDYWQRVFSYFLDEFRLGRTPNPDILCNKEIKFRAFLDYAKQRGADYIATGHYARTRESEQGIQLLKAFDQNKDQSYFLHALTQEQLSQSCFPLGELEKPKVRAIAQSIGLCNYAKKDSTGICFIGERKFKRFLQDYLPAQPGAIESTDGEVLGQHDGLMFYTIGQRQGLAIGGQKTKAALPWYVAHKDLARNVLVVVQGDHSALYRSHLTTTAIHWIHTTPRLPHDLMAKTRYRQADQACILHKKEAHFELSFAVPQRAITEGQSVVFYQDDICLGGGIIGAPC